MQCGSAFSVLLAAFSQDILEIKYSRAKVVSFHEISNFSLMYHDYLVSCSNKSQTML